MTAKKIVIFFMVLGVSGCASQQDVIMQRNTKRQMSLSVKQAKAPKGRIQIESTSSTISKDNIEITASYVSDEYLENFFKNKELFGSDAGTNPYLPEVMVFYVKIINNSGGKIRFEPKDFAVIDDLRSQYMYLSDEDIVDFYATRASMYGFVRTTGDVAPGIYGAPLRIAGGLGGSPLRKRLNLLHQVSLRGGYLHTNVIYDGYIAFLKPNFNAKALHLIFPNIKTEFDADDRATKTTDFMFDYNVSFK